MGYKQSKYVSSLSDKRYTVKEYETGKYIIKNKITWDEFYCSHEEMSSMSLDKIENLRISSYNPLDMEFMEDIQDRL